MNNQEVLAVVAGKNVTSADFEAFLKNMPEEQKLYAANPRFRTQFFEQMIAHLVYAELGAEMKLEETEEFQNILANVKKDILAQLAVQKVVDAAVVTDEEKKEYYDANSQQFQKKATVRAKHILMKEEAACAELLESLKKGEKEFEQAAKEFSECPSGSNGGDLGQFGKGQMVKEFEDVAFTAEIGEIAGPVKTQFGYHLIKVELRTEASVIPFEEVRFQIEKNLVQQKQTRIYSDKAAELKEKYVQK